MLCVVTKQNNENWSSRLLNNKLLYHRHIVIKFLEKTTDVFIMYE